MGADDAPPRPLAVAMSSAPAVPAAPATSAAAAAVIPTASSHFQADFHQRWSMLRNPHTRALAWLLDAPDLLDASAPRWQGKIASLPPHAADDARDWLYQLDAAPQALDDDLGVHPLTRLGRYAENLLAWYFRHRGILVAHGLQVRAGKGETIGEFDFLLRQRDALVHWEFATKFYLMSSEDPALAGVQRADYFVGPNLADTLGKKIRKILDRQLMLGHHPAAQALLPQPLADAQALMKGWLFYRRGEVPALLDAGVSPHHCRGWWCTPDELDSHVGSAAAIIPRIAWMAPARLPLTEDRSVSTLRQQVIARFEHDPMPLMVAALRQDGDAWLETERGFVVPDQWPQQAGRRLADQAVQVETQSDKLG